MKKQKLIIILAVTIVAVLGFVVYRNLRAKNCETSELGNCLPVGKCIAPNDAIVDCEKLKQFPFKTDWSGNE